jgi:hypothetical protein
MDELGHWNMPFVIGGFAALVALAAGILAQVDPLTSLWRAGLVFVLGWIGANMWYVVTNLGRQPLELPEAAIAPPGEAETS